MMKYKTAALAASIALALGTTAAYAAPPAAPAADQLPGQGALVTAGTATAGTVTNGAQTITLTGNTVINWGAASGATINAKNTTTTTAEPAGFNVGSSAALTFSGAFGVLNVDVSGNPSQIMGQVLGDATVGSVPTAIYVANANGIIVGASGSIVAAGAKVGLFGNQLTQGDDAAWDGTVGGVAGIVYNGQNGGDVTVAPGATLTGTSVLVSGGNNVNVDLGALTAPTTMQAGINTDTSTLSGSNKAATLTVGGTLAAGGSVVDFESAGAASNSAALDLSAATTVSVGGLLTNTGDLTLGAPATTTLAGVTNSGQLTATGLTVGGDLTNNGTLTAGGALQVNGGSINNAGTVTATTVGAMDGSITNNGSISGVTSVTTDSDAEATKGGQYFITNSGTITSAGALTLDANSAHGSNSAPATANASLGSVTNLGNLQVGVAGGLTINANNGVNLAGNVQVQKAAVVPPALPVFVASSTDHPLGAVAIDASGNVTVNTALTGSGATIRGAQVALMQNLSAGTAGTVQITAGGVPAAGATDPYAVRVANGMTVSGATVTIQGDKASDNPNVILQGQLSGNTVNLGAVGGQVSDVFSGPNGGLQLGSAAGAGTDGTLNIKATGAIKTAPYLNNTSDARFNFLPVWNNGPDALALNIDAAGLAGTVPASGMGSAYNILVKGDVTLANTGATPTGVPTASGGTTVIGVNTVPDTHLVLQSTGNISTAGYWPGFVYLGTVDSNAAGDALPGSLSAAGTISLTGNFNNIMPGSIAIGTGIHFATANPLTAAAGTTVLTNANAWVVFGTDLLTQNYSQGILTNPGFVGGSQLTGSNVINYGKLPASDIQTQGNVLPGASK